MNPVFGQERQIARRCRAFCIGMVYQISDGALEIDFHATRLPTTMHTERHLFGFIFAAGLDMKQLEGIGL